MIKITWEETACAIVVHYYEDQVGRKSNCWYPQTNWAPWHKKELYFVWSVVSSVSTEVIKSVFREREACQSIDLAPMHWQKGKLEIRKNWSRLAMDITHYGRRHLLSLINCGPSWFMLWQPLLWQDFASVVYLLELFVCFFVFLYMIEAHQSNYWQWYDFHL